MDFNTENPFFKYGNQYSKITTSQIFKYEKPYFKTGEIKNQQLVIKRKVPLKPLYNLGVWKSIPFYKYQYEINN